MPFYLILVRMNEQICAFIFVLECSVFEQQCCAKRVAIVFIFGTLLYFSAHVFHKHQ